jgi:hypothetical protein
MILHLWGEYSYTGCTTMMGKTKQNVYLWIYVLYFRGWQGPLYCHSFGWILWINICYPYGVGSELVVKGVCRCSKLECSLQYRGMWMLKYLFMYYKIPCSLLISNLSWAFHISTIAYNHSYTIIFTVLSCCHYLLRILCLYFKHVTFEYIYTVPIVQLCTKTFKLNTSICFNLFLFHLM